MDTTAIISAQPDQGAAYGKRQEQAGCLGATQMAGRSRSDGLPDLVDSRLARPAPNTPNLTLDQFTGSSLATVGAVTKDTVKGQAGNTAFEYAVVPLVNGTPENVENQLVEATTGAHAGGDHKVQPAPGCAGNQGHDHRHGLDGGDIGHLQRNQGQDHDRYGHADRGEGPSGGHHRAYRGADAQGHRGLCDKLHGEFQLRGRSEPIAVLSRLARTDGKREFAGWSPVCP